MRYGIKTFFILFILLTFSGCRVFSPSEKRGKLHTIAFYTLENLYDTTNDPAINDEAYLPDGALNWTEDRYNLKIKKLASTIATMGGKNGPAIIGLGEVENLQVIKDLLGTSALRDKKYEVIHYDSPDKSGLDIALLYKPKFFKPTFHAVIPIAFTEANYESTGILQVRGLLQGEPITIYVNDWPAASTSRRQSERRKRAAAVTLRQEINAQQKIDKDTRIIVMGNFAADPSAAVLEQALLATGRPDPAYNQELFNAFYMFHVQDKGSSFYRGKFQMHDQIMVSKSWVNNQGLELVRGSAAIHSPVSLEHTFGKYKNTPIDTYAGTTYHGGASAHFPIYIKVRKER